MIRKFRGKVLLLVFCFTASGFSQQPASPGVVAAPQAGAPAPTRIGLDVLVTDKAGKPVPELEPTDLSLLDNGQPRKILGFRRTDGVAGSKFDPPVEVIIVLDAVNIPYQGVTQLRQQLERFLRRNGGQLAQPVSVFVYTSLGLQVQPRPSKDGNVLAAMIDTSVGTVRAGDTAAGDYGLAEQFTSSIKTLKNMAENEAHKPGRKMLIWLGSGWPLLNGRNFLRTNEGEPRHFADIVDVSRKLREARITLYAVFTLIGSENQLYQAYLKPVKEFHKADAGNLSLQVLALETGGRVIDPSNDVPGLIDMCIADIGASYTLVFTPPPRPGRRPTSTTI